MLVLSRRPQEDILFPNTNIRIRILDLKGNVVRVGIEAPPEVQVLRGEIAGAAAEKLRTARSDSWSHDLRNRLNKVTLGLHHFYQQCQAGLLAKAEESFQQVLDALEALDREWPHFNGTRPRSPAAPGRRCRTLLVEDDANERELLAGILGMHGCDCDTVADGQAALDYLASHETPDLVLLDMGLPRVSGQQAVGWIRQQPQWRGLKIFAVSGADPADLGVPLGRGGVDAWFHKPLNPRRLWEAIQQEMAATSKAN